MGNKILDNFAEIKLLEEAYMGNLKEIYKLVDQGVNINYADEAGETALLVAARVGHYPIVAHLLKIGADANVKSKSGSTAVSSARSNDDWNMIRLLKAYGATANQSQFHVQSNIVGAGGGFGRGDEPIEQLVNNQNPTDEVLFTL